MSDYFQNKANFAILLKINKELKYRSKLITIEFYFSVSVASEFGKERA